MLRVTKIALFGLIVTVLSCQDLEIEQQNSPDFNRAFSTIDQVEMTVGSQYLTWWSATQKNYPGMTLSVMSNNAKSMWGNFGMQHLGTYPGNAFINDPSSEDIYNLAAVPWAGLYSAISNTNSGLQWINQQEITGSEDYERIARVKAFGKFIQGISYGFLANYFDQAALVDEHTDLEALSRGRAELSLSPYSEVLDFAIDKLSEAIQIAESNHFTIPSNWISGHEMDAETFSKLAKAYKARIMASNARTWQEREQLDWETIKALSYEAKDASFFSNDDQAFIIHADGQFWWSRMHSLHVDRYWIRPYYYLIGPYDQSGNFEQWLDRDYTSRRNFLMDNKDKRIQDGEHDTDEEGHLIIPDGSDFKAELRSVLPACARHCYLETRYTYHRNMEMYLNGFIGPMQHIRRTELTMYIAEALLHENKLLLSQEAIDLINETRVDRGNLPPVTTLHSWDYVFNAMRYEYGIETYATAAGINFFNVRSWGNWKGEDYGGIFDGTPLHFPIPALELELLNMDQYTFGGEGNSSINKAFEEASRFDISPRN